MLRHDYAIYATSGNRYLLLLTVNSFEFQSRLEATSDKEVQENDRWEVRATLGWKSVLGRVITDHIPSLYVIRERAQLPSWYKDNRLSTREKWTMLPPASCRSYINVRRDIKEANRVQNKSSLCGTNPSTAGHPFSLAASTQWPVIVPTGYEANNASISKILQWEPLT